MKLFSAFAASTLLERDRQTIARALRGTPPDGKERGQPRWKMSTIVSALEKHGCPSVVGPDRLGQIADELERLHTELATAIELIKTLPDLDTKQPHSRAAMKLIDRLDALYKEANGLLAERDPTSLASYVTGPLIGTCFRTLLAAIYGPEAEIDGERMFTDRQIKQFKLA